jgi:hypothetical protein
VHAVLSTVLTGNAEVFCLTSRGSEWARYSLAAYTANVVTVHCGVAVPVRADTAAGAPPPAVGHTNDGPTTPADERYVVVNNMFAVQLWLIAVPMLPI